MTKCLCCDQKATHAFCNKNLEATDPCGNLVYVEKFVYCNNCALNIFSRGEAEICSCCDSYDSNKVFIGDEELKPLYVRKSLINGMCQSHP
jgi:hypothetical protein